MIETVASVLVVWIILYLSTRIRTERNDRIETHYIIPYRAFLIVGVLTGLVTYALTHMLSGVPLAYMSSLLILLFTQATIDYRYKEIALEWVGLTVLINMAYVWYEQSYSHHMLGFVFVVFAFMILCSVLAGLGVGDTLLLTGLSLVFYPGTFERVIWTYLIGLRWFFLVFAIPQVLIWVYLAYRRARKQPTDIKQMTIPFIPFYTVSFLMWLFGLLTGYI